MTEKNTEVFGWDDPIEKGAEFPVLPEGTATFEVLKIERARKEMGKLGTCNVALLTLLVTSDENGETATFIENLPLHRKTQFKLFQFFSSIGMRQHGNDAPFVPNWGKVSGTTGSCKIGIREWKGKDGETHKSNEVVKYLDPPSEADVQNLKF